MTAAPAAPHKLPMANAAEISARDQPNSSLIGVTNTDSTAPYIGTCANAMTVDAETMPQPKKTRSNGQNAGGAGRVGGRKLGRRFARTRRAAHRPARPCGNPAPHCGAPHPASAASK